MPDTPQLWSIAEVTEYLGAASTGSARRTLSRWGVSAVEYQLGASGRPEARFNADAVRTAHSGRPGRGVKGGVPDSIE